MGTPLALLPGEVVEADGLHDRLVTIRDEANGDAIVGIVGTVETDDGVEYLGCIGCRQEITRTEGGMCCYCRSDLAAREDA